MHDRVCLAVQVPFALEAQVQRMTDEAAVLGPQRASVRAAGEGRHAMVSARIEAKKNVAED